MLSDANIRQINLSCIRKIENKLIKQKKLELWLKRDDLIDSQISGNKWRKLYYNVMKAKHLDCEGLLTFGGAFSNHIAATAAAGQRWGLPTIGIIRGEKVLPLNPTLAFAQRCGMGFQFIDRSTYRKKQESNFFEKLINKYPNFYILPEGGTNNLAIKACEDIVFELKKQCFPAFPDYITVSCGTGGTISGIISGLQKTPWAAMTQVLGFSALKGDFLKKDITTLLQHYTYKKPPFIQLKWQVLSNYHFGGYAKFKMELIDFINQFKIEQGVSLDPIYTGKMLYGIFDLIKKDFFKEGSKIVAIHTGGLQGIEGFNQRFGNILLC